MVGSHPSLVESIVRTSPPLRTSLAARLSSHDPSPPPGADNGIGTHGDSLQPEHAGGQVMDESARVASTVDSLEETISRSSPRWVQCGTFGWPDDVGNQCGFHLVLRYLSLQFVLSYQKSLDLMCPQSF